MMRALILIAAAAIATPAAAPVAAQDYLGLILARDAERIAAEEAARQRDIALNNEISRLEAQAQTNQALAGLAAQRAPVVLPTVPRDPKAPPPVIDMSKFASIPDAILADSNAKVRAAAANRK